MFKDSELFQFLHIFTDTCIQRDNLVQKFFSVGVKPQMLVVIDVGLTVPGEGDLGPGKIECRPVFVKHHLYILGINDFSWIFNFKGQSGHEKGWVRVKGEEHIIQAPGIENRLISLDIDQDFIRRDRLIEDAEAMAELQASIKENGLRAPIEVAKTEAGYGLISGFRRLQAYRALAADSERFVQIPAFVRDADAGQAAYVSMVEENEVRANLSHYERGRIAVLAADQSVFTSVEAAVDALFGTASKAKRSKVRSFAKVHEALGDLLQFPTGLTEKAGLALATALRDGGQSQLRAALAEASAQDAKSEWVLLQKAMKSASVAPRDKSRGGRPQEITQIPSRDLPKGGALSAEVSADGLRIELKGRVINADTAEQILNMIAHRIG